MRDANLHWLGVDVGWVHPAADSDGDVYPWTRRRTPGYDLLREAGPVKVTKADGTTYMEPALTLTTAAVVEARYDPSAVRVVATKIVSKAKRSGRGIALENWRDFSRRKAAWVQVWRAIEAQAIARDVDLTQVNRAYTSITCPKCGLKARANRETRARFCCVGCGYSGHADVVAAINIAAKAADTFRIDQGVCENPICDRSRWAAGLCSPCYHFRRRHGRLPVVDDTDPDPRVARAKRQLAVQRERVAAREEREYQARLEWTATHDAWGNPKVVDERVMSR